MMQKQRTSNNVVARRNRHVQHVEWKEIDTRVAGQSLLTGIIDRNRIDVGTTECDGQTGSTRPPIEPNRHVAAPRGDVENSQRQAAIFLGEKADRLPQNAIAAANPVDARQAAQRLMVL